MGKVAIIPQQKQHVCTNVIFYMVLRYSEKLSLITDYHLTVFRSYTLCHNNISPAEEEEFSILLKKSLYKCVLEVHMKLGADVQFPHIFKGHTAYHAEVCQVIG